MNAFLKTGVFFICLMTVSHAQDQMTNNILPVVGDGIQAISLFDVPLSMPEPSEDLVANREAAKADYDRDPDNLDYLIWYGRKLAYAGDYRGAIKIFSRGMEIYPEESRLYRHRCHRYLTIREFDRALADCKKGAMLIEGREDSIEPDGAPNAANIPIYTRHSTIWYHLGLAYYFTQDFENAHIAFQNGKDLHVNNDMEVSFSHWNYMTLRRLGREQEAQATVATIPDDIAVYESQAYLQLIDLYKGKIKVDELWQNTAVENRSSAFTYGIANWYLYNGDRERAFDMMNEIAQPSDFSGYGWGAFGFIAAEADLKMRK